MKRVVGVPGDRIRIDGHRLVRNGVMLTRPAGEGVVTGGPHAGFRVFREGEGDGYPVLVGPAGPAAHVDTVELGPGELYLLGDNRSVSRDSRESGPVSRGQVVGRAVAVAFSYDLDGARTFREGRVLEPLR